MLIHFDLSSIEKNSIIAQKLSKKSKDGKCRPKPTIRKNRIWCNSTVSNGCFQASNQVKNKVNSNLTGKKMHKKEAASF
jgi:hypothetical protein